jgi:hypothetical protein
MERKMMLGGSSLMAVVALVGLILVGGNSSKRDQISQRDGERLFNRLRQEHEQDRDR